MRSLVNSFSIIHRQSAIMLDRKLRALNLPVGQFMYILCICANEGMSQEQVAAQLRIDKGAIARTTRHLLEEGYIERQVSPADRRQYQIFPTEKSRRIHHEINDISSEWEEKLTSELTDIEADLLKSLLDKVVQALL